jgi:hypothetical protein
VRVLVRSAVVLAGALAVGFAGVAAAATPAGPKTLTFSDPAGDNISPSASGDITQITFSTSGTGTGKKYVAKNLVVTMKLGAAPEADGSTVYAVHTQLAGCGYFNLEYMPGARVLDNFNTVECVGDGSATDTSNVFDAVPDVVGTSLVWTLPFRSLPTPVKAGSTFTDLNAFTDFRDPALSIFGPSGFGLPPLYDTASTDKTYVVG